MKKIGYFSSRAAILYGYAVYKTPKGVEVECTEVCNEDRKPVSVWADLELVGEVTNYVRSVERLNKPYKMYNDYV